MFKFAVLAMPRSDAIKPAAAVARAGSTIRGFQLSSRALNTNDPEFEDEIAVAQSVPANHDPYTVLRIRDFRLYLIGRLAAVFGQQMLTVAVGWQLYKRTGSALALALVGLTEMVAMVVCTLPAGHFADNVNRKRIILAALLASTSASLGLAVVSWTHAPVFWIYVCLFTFSVSRTFLWPASSAF